MTDIHRQRVFEMVARQVGPMTDPGAIMDALEGELLAPTHEMIRFLLDELENRDGYSPSIASCPECTVGTVPDSQNKGPCLYHQALKLFA